MDLSDLIKKAGRQFSKLSLDSRLVAVTAIGLFAVLLALAFFSSLFNFFPAAIAPTPAPVDGKFPLVAYVRAVDTSGTPLKGVAVKLSFGESSYLANYTGPDGIASFSLQQKHPFATILAQASGYEQSRSTMQNLSGNEISTVIMHSLDLGNLQEGVELFVDVSFGGRPAAAQVTLADYSSGTLLAQASSSPSSPARFASVPAGSTFLISARDNSNHYHDSPIPYAARGMQMFVSIELRQAASGYVTATVYESAAGISTPSEGASVSAFGYAFDAANAFVFEGVTNLSGQAVIAFPNSSQKLLITAYKPGFLAARTAAGPQTDSVELLLERENSSNSAEVIARVELDGQPLQGATIDFRDERGASIGYPPKKSDASGSASYRLPKSIGNAYAQAVWKDRQSESQAQAVRPGATYLVQFNSSDAEIALRAFDATDSSLVSNASFSIYLSSDRSPVSSCSPGQDGSCTARVPAYQSYRAVASAQGYYEFESAEFTPSSGATVRVDASLLRRTVPEAALDPNATFLGFYTKQGVRVEQAASAKDYEARFRLSSLPSQKPTGFFARLGTECDSSSTPAFITYPAVEIPVFFGSFRPASSCNPANSSNELKWVFLYFPEGLRGTRDVVIPLRTRAAGGLQEPVRIELAYSYFLPDSTSVSEDALNLSKTALPVSRSEMPCADGLCRKVEFFNSTGSATSSFLERASGSVRVELKSDRPIGYVSVNSLVLNFPNASNPHEITIPASPSGPDHFLATSSFLASNRSVNSPVAFQAIAPDGISGIGNPFYSAITVTGPVPIEASAEPEIIRAAERALVNVSVTAKNGSLPQDALVELSNCEGSPLPEPLSIRGDHTIGKGFGGNYSFEVYAIASGKIGVSVKHQDYVTFGKCAIAVEPPRLISASPKVLDFITNPSAQPLVRVQNLVSESLSVYASGYCPDGARVDVGPQETYLEANARFDFAIGAPLQQAGAHNCTVSFAAITASYLSSVENVTVLFNGTIPTPVPTGTPAGSPTPPTGPTPTGTITPYPSPTVYPTIEPAPLPEETKITDLSGLPAERVVAIDEKTKRGTLLLATEFDFTALCSLLADPANEPGSIVPQFSNERFGCENGVFISFDFTGFDLKKERLGAMVLQFYKIKTGETRDVKIKFVVTDATRLRYCVHVQGGQLSYDDLMGKANDIGANAVVIYFPWGAFNGDGPGKYSWGDVDSAYQSAQKYGRVIIPRIGGGPPGWATSASGRPAPEHYDDFADASKAFVKHVIDGGYAIYGVQLWNEPNLPWEWGDEATGRADPHEFTAMFKKASAKIRELGASQVKILFPGLSPCQPTANGYYNDEEFLEAAYADGVGDYFDALGSHSYLGPGGACGPADRAQAYSRILAGHGDSQKEMWFTELGSAGYEPGHPGLEEKIAGEIPKIYSEADSWGKVGPVCWWIMAGNGNWEAQDMLDKGGNARLAYSAYKSMAKPLASFSGPSNFDVSQCDSIQFDFSQVPAGRLSIPACIQAYGGYVACQAKANGALDSMQELFQIIMQESLCNLEARGDNGLPLGQSRSWGCGLMQIESLHEGSFGSIYWPASRLYDPSAGSCYNPRNNVAMGVSIYARYLAAQRGDKDMALCSYNKGVGGANAAGRAACMVYPVSAYRKWPVPSSEQILSSLGITGA